MVFQLKSNFSVKVKYLFLKGEGCTRLYFKTMLIQDSLVSYSVYGLQYNILGNFEL